MCAARRWNTRKNAANAYASAARNTEIAHRPTNEWERERGTMNYYNELEPYLAQWLRNLIVGGMIAEGIVDERSIEDVKAEKLEGYDQCHFFAGIGVWSYALRKAGWPDDRPVWTGSCPCQPFSCAGKRKGTGDPRHLWPAWFRLIEARRPPVIFGEQVASKDGLAWLDIVYADLEGAGYTVAAFDLCAAGFGAPHRRQRLYFVADTMQPGRQERNDKTERSPRPTCNESAPHGGTSVVADTEDGRGRRKSGAQRSVGRSGSSGLAYPDGGNTHTEREQRGGKHGQFKSSRGPTNGFWADAEWIYCTDEKYRATQPGVFPLAHGAAQRVGRLRAYGNAIVAPVAEAFVKAYMEYETNINIDTQPYQMR